MEEKPSQTKAMKPKPQPITMPSTSISVAPLTTPDCNSALPSPILINQFYENERSMAQGRLSQNIILPHMQSAVKREPVETNENLMPSSNPQLTNMDSYKSAQNLPAHLMNNQNLASYHSQQSPPQILPTKPIDMNVQEQHKIERKRERNRAAATKCRHRKLERIQLLEDTVRDLTHKNQDLKSERNSLKQELEELHQRIEQQPILREQMRDQHYDHAHLNITYQG